MQNKSALVVDDSRVARMMLIKYLKAHGFEITEYGSGEEALDWLQTTDRKPDIIFMDVMMDGMDGLTATRQIKVIPELRHIPVVICTGNDTEEDRRDAYATGAESVLTKPPAAVAVEQIIQQVESKQEALIVEEVSEPVAEPVEVTPVAAAPSTIDETALVNQVLQSFREQFMPGLETQLKEMAQEVEREVAAQLSQPQQPDMAELQLQIDTAINSAIEQNKQQLEPLVTNLMNEFATKAVEQAIQSYGLTEKMMSMLHHDGLNWLKQQEHTLRDSVKKQMQEQLPVMNSDYMDMHLVERIKPLLESQIDDCLVQSSENFEKQVSRLKSQATTATAISVVAVVVAVAAVAAIFLL